MLLPAFVNAETNAFFDPNAARTVFSPSVEVTVGGEIPESYKSPLPKNASVKPISEQKSPDSVTVEKSLSADARSKLIEQFGDPTKDVALRTADTAPVPFKGMMAALDAGDDTLAQQYAEQFQRYTEKLQRSNLTAVNLLAGVAHEREMEAKAQLDVNRSNIKTLITPEELAKLKQSESRGGVEGQVSKESVESTGLEGKVQVFFFFSSSDTKSGAAAREIERLAAISRNDTQLQIVGVAADMMGSKAALDFKARYELSFSVVADTQLANSMGVQALPAVAFVIPKTLKIELRSGLIPFAEVKQTVEKMKEVAARS